MYRKIVKAKYYLEDDFREELAEVPDSNKEDILKNQNKYIGSPLDRADGYEKVSGTAKYTFDIELNEMCYAVTLRCPHPHAKIINIDVSKAEEAEGVLDIIHYKNTEPIKWYNDTSYLFDTTLRYEGDEVACVAAETKALAEHASKLIKVEYEILQHSVRPEDSIKQETVKIHNWGNVNQDGKPVVYSRGDCEKGFSDSEYIFEDEYKTQVVIHNPTEPHCSVALWEGDKLTVWDSTQGVYSSRTSLVNALKMPENKIRVIKKYMGGGFGSKLEGGKYTVMASLLAKRIGRPVKIVLNRKEQNLAVGNRPDSIQKFKAGVKSDGTLISMHHSNIGSMGAYPTGAGCNVPVKTMYKCPNILTEQYSVFINAGRGRAMRAPGHVQGTFALESFMDVIAEKLNMDPLEFRLKNYTDEDQEFNLPYTSKLLKECYTKGAEAIGWYSKRKKTNSDSGVIKRGIGMASQIWWGGGTPPAYAEVRMNSDGSVVVQAGTQDLGTGTYTILAQIAAEVFDIPIEMVSVELGDTQEHPYCGVSGGSLTTPSVTPAVYDACIQIKNKLLSAAAIMLNTTSESIDYSEGRFFIKEEPERTKTNKEIIKELKNQMIVANGARNANPDKFAINTFGAHFAEVEVNIETGNIKILKIAAAHDVGRVINPKLLENQIHGGIIQAIGFALFENRVIDNSTGKVLTTNLHSYKLPTIMDTPEIETIIVSEGDYKISAVGAKGVGEPPHIPTAGAIANAIYNATGVRIKSLPITPDIILNELYKQ